MTNVTVQSQIYRLFILCSSVSVRWFLTTIIPITAQNNRQPFNKVNKRDVSTDANWSWHRHKHWLYSLFQFLGNLRYFAVMLRNLHSDTETKQNKKKRVRKRVFPQAKADTRRWMLRDSLTSRKFVCWWVWTCRFPPRHFVPPYQRGRCSDATATLSNRENRHLYSRRDQSKTQPMSSKAGSFSVNFHPDQLWSIFQKPPVTEKKI